MEDFMVNLVAILVPLAGMSIPVLIVWFTSRVKKNADNRRAEVLRQLIETKPDQVDAELIIKSLGNEEKKPKTAQDKQNARLQAGCICTLIGLAGLITYLIPSLEMDVLFLYLAAVIMLPVGLALLAVYFVNRRKLAGNGLKTAE